MKTLKKLNSVIIALGMVALSHSALAALANQDQAQGQQQGQAQGQIQGQAQGQAQIGINKNSNQNANANVNGNKNINSVSGKNTNINGVTSKNTNVNGQAQKTENANNSNQNVNVEGDNVVYKAPEIPVSTAYAPSIQPTAPCMGSSSGGGQGMNIGISFGTTWTSEECLMLETARSFDQAGHKADAQAVRCQAKYAKVAPTCVALAKAAAAKEKAAMIEAVQPVAKATPATQEVQEKIAVQSHPAPVVSKNGYYSVVVNPLAK